MIGTSHVHVPRTTIVALLLAMAMLAGWGLMSASALTADAASGAGASVTVAEKWPKAKGKKW